MPSLAQPVSRGLRFAQNGGEFAPAKCRLGVFFSKKHPKKGKKNAFFFKKR